MPVHFDATRLRRLIASNGLTQGSLAERLGVKRETVNSWCNEKRPPQSLHPENVKALSDVFGVSREAWFVDEGQIPEDIQQIIAAVKPMRPELRARLMAFLESLAAYDKSVSS